MQSFVLLPLMVAPVIAAIMIRWMFNDQFGVVNAALGGLGVPPIAWLTQNWTAFLAILLTDVWLWTPWFALMLLAGLQSLPPEPFEAAQIDAASAWRTFRYITLPMLRPVIVVCVVIRAIDAFRTFDIVWTISGGGPARATEVFSIYAYVEAFQFLNFGRGSAAAVIGALIIVVFAMALYRILNRWVEVSQVSAVDAVLPEPRRAPGFFEALAPGGRRVLFVLGLDRRLPAVRLPRVLAGADLAAAWFRRLLRAPRHRLHARQLPRRAARRRSCSRRSGTASRSRRSRPCCRSASP